MNFKIHNQLFYILLLTNLVMHNIWVFLLKYIKIYLDWNLNLLRFENDENVLKKIIRKLSSPTHTIIFSICEIIFPEIFKSRFYKSKVFSAKLSFTQKSKLFDDLPVD